MNAKDFFDLVAEMRKAQKAYFKMRISENLTRKHKLENLVDAEIRSAQEYLKRKKDPQTTINFE